ncbi:MAG: hypothetical protein GKS00_05230 [Alphaproteobacteria bacterium]|nr:hypothetical protein [Alphaproteobacteria bacterium]
MLNMTASTTDVGLRQVIEDALSILQGGQVADDRRKFVISDLKKLFDLASRGSELAEQENLLFGVEDISAYESFSFVEQHVRHEFNGELGERLSEVCGVFSKLNTGEAIAQEEGEKSSEFLSVFLGKVEKEPTTFTSTESDIFQVA